MILLSVYMKDEVTSMKVIPVYVGKKKFNAGFSTMFSKCSGSEWELDWHPVILSNTFCVGVGKHCTVIVCIQSF